MKVQRHLLELAVLCNAVPSSPVSEVKGEDGIDSRKRDVETRALLALRKATVEQRADIFRKLGAELGPDAALSVLTDLSGGLEWGRWPS